jgi:uncharacterized membrane protein
MVHLFRAEIQRANVWRQRLDTTTNWAVVATGAAVTVAFNPGGFHGVILLNILLVTLFLWTEARRYRYYELWSYRVRLMETDFYAAMLVPPFQPAPDWAESLAENLLHPHFPISLWEAFGRRLRRNYLWIYMILFLAWLTKIAVLPGMPADLPALFRRADMGALTGEVIFILLGAFYIYLVVVSFATRGLHQATGEVLPRYTTHLAQDLFSTERPTGPRAWFRSSFRRQQLMALIITDQAQAVGEHILREMRRGVTALSGKGMYTGKEHTVLLCALTITEVGRLKAIVQQSDPNAFVIVSPAQEILGRGFQSFNSDSK